MPFLRDEPWCDQYFTGVDCPEEVVIPVVDSAAYQCWPEHRWVYNKLRVCETQGMACAPHGIRPPAFPVFSKPIYNLSGMGAGGRIIVSSEQYERDHTPGHMWMPLLVGEHVSSDVVVLDGEPTWWRHTIGKRLSGGTFDYWAVLADSLPHIESYCGGWLRRNLRGYTGCVNLECIGGKIIEAHLRLTVQWLDLYRRSWLESVVELYRSGRWVYRDEERRNGYSVVLFAAHGLLYHGPGANTISEVLRRPSISSVQITFFEDEPPELHAMPPGGFRLAIVNCWDLDAGLAARETLAQHFTPPVSPARRARRAFGPPSSRPAPARRSLPHRRPSPS